MYICTKQFLMTTITFTLAQQQDIQKVLAILKIFGAQNIQSKSVSEKLPTSVVKAIEEGLEDIENGAIVSSEEVHKKALELCTQ